MLLINTPICSRSSEKQGPSETLGPSLPSWYLLASPPSPALLSRWEPGGVGVFNTLQGSQPPWEGKKQPSPPITPQHPPAPSPRLYSLSIAKVLLEYGAGG